MESNTWRLLQVTCSSFSHWISGKGMSLSRNARRAASLERKHPAPVYRATDPKLNREVAIKILPKDFSLGFGNRNVAVRDTFG